MESLSTQLQPFAAWLLRSTVQASALICLILLAQLLLRHKLGPRWSHALWLILLARMVLPWAPASHFSIFNLIPRSGSPVGWGLPHRLPDGGLKPTVLRNSASTGETPASAGAGSQQSPHELSSRQYVRSVRAALPLIWLTGAIVLGIYICVSSFSLLRIVRRERPLTDQKILDLVEDCKAEMGIRIVLGVVATDKVRSACLFGFVRPRLLLPKGMVEALSREELRYVFLHELGHLKRHDIYLGWLTSILQALHWFNPLIWLAFYRMRADREFACDAVVLARAQPDQSKNYGRTIISLLERFSRPQVLPALAGILETKSQLKRRIKMIAKSKKSSPMQWAAAVLIFAVLAGVGLTDAYPAPPPFEFGTPVNLGPNINTSSRDAGPTISADGCTMYFGSERAGGYGDYDVYVATRESTNSEWGPAVNLGPNVNTPYLDGPWSISADGLSLYLVSNRPDGYGDFDLWVTRRTTSTAPWGTPVNLGPAVNTIYADNDPSISADGLSLYFDSTRPGGYGSSDLWVTKRTNLSAPWGPAVNLGLTVNGSYSEYQPSISADGLLLFFASDRPDGFGPDDIYVTTRASVSDPWGPPVNLGPPVNTSYDEFCANISGDGSILYFSSNRAGGYGRHDIWQAPILAAPACGDSKHPYPAGDLNKDCRVDLADLALLLAHWLECTTPECD